MRQLTALDQQFLALEDSRHYGHVGSLAILDPSTAPSGSVSLLDLQRLIEERLALVPPFRWRLAEVPFNLDYAYWAQDPEFDIEFHVRELGLAPPGTDLQLSEQVARIFARPLDRSRPLWEIYLIHGLPRDRIAVLSKIHHAVIDGISGAEIMGALLDLTPEGPERAGPGSAGIKERSGSPDGGPVRGSPVPDGGQARGYGIPDPAPPGQLEMLARGLASLPRYPVRLLRSIPTALPNIEEVPPLAGLPGVKTAGQVVAAAQRALGRGGGRVVGRLDLVPHAPRSAAASQRTGGLPSGVCPWPRLRRSSSTTSARSTTSWSRSAPGRSGAG